MVIPFVHCDDQLMWQHSDSGLLSFKDSYNFPIPRQQPLDWGKIIWNSSIPPSRSFLI